MIDVPIVKEIYNHNIGLSYFSVKNFYLSGIDTTNVKKIYGKSYMLTFRSFAYFHYFQDGIGQYLLLKKYIPELKLVVVAEQEYPYFQGTFDEKQSANMLRESLRMLGIGDKDFIYRTKTAIWFEELNYIGSAFNPYLNGISKNDVYNASQARSNIMQSISDGFQDYLVKKRPLKLYVSRGNRTDFSRNYCELGKKIDKGEATEEEIESFNYFIKDISPANLLLENHVFARYLSAEDERKIEEFFIHRGYLVIDPEKFSFEEQINLYYNATHIASVSGTGLYNCVFSERDANIFILYLSNGYRYYHDENLRMLFDNVYEAPMARTDITGDKLRHFDVDWILKYLAETFNDQL